MSHLQSYPFRSKRTFLSAWAEIHDVFGDGHDYDWALEGDDDAEFNEDVLKPDMKYQDVSILILSDGRCKPDYFIGL